jgi:hypothetical protein
MTAPTQLVDAFAHGAAGPNITFPIPENQGTPGSGTASFDLGFPPETMQNPAAGGVPPFGQDMNGVLFMISSVVAFLNQGNTFQFSSGFAASIGGYAAGSIVQSARTDSPGSGFWLNTVANNSSDPDASTASGWVPISNYGYTTVAASSAVGGVITLTAQQAARSAVIITGTLAGNLSVVFPPWLDSWLVINTATVGAFALTARTAAGTGVTVPPGGFAQPTGIYGDGTNIYSSVTPLTVPIDQNPTPLTLVERTNSGYILGQYFNQASAIENVPNPDAVFVESANDGFLRKMPWAQLKTLIGTAAAVTGGWDIGGFQLRYGSLNVPGAIVNNVTFGTAFTTQCETVLLVVRGSTGVEFFCHSPPGGTPSTPSTTAFSVYSNANAQIDYVAIGN